MTGVAAALAALVAGWMAWRGYRRGAVGTLVGWLPGLAAVTVLLVLLRSAWAHPEHLGLLFWSGCIGALAVFVGGKLSLRLLRCRAARSPTEQAESRRWLGVCDRVSGAALGLVCAAVLLLAFACLASTVHFILGADSVPEDLGCDTTPPEWVDALRQTCGAVADISHFGLLAHIPRMGVYSREVRALITVLRAPRDKIEHVVQKRGLLQLGELDEVQEALLDDEYMALIRRVGKGDVSALPDLVRSPVTRRVIRCPEVGEIAKGLTPSELARDLDEVPAAPPGGDETEEVE